MALDTLQPAGIGRAKAAKFCGLSPNSFDVAVKSGRLPQPIKFGRKEGRFIWTVTGLRAALDALAGTTAGQSTGGSWKDVGKGAIRR